MDTIISLKGVTKLYGRFKALDDLTVSVRAGAIGLLGPNGAGKTTLIKTLLGLVRLSRGEASVLGLNVRSQAKRIREIVGYLPEDDCFIAGLKGVQSVALGGELAGLPRRTALRRAHEILDYVTLGEARYREVQTYSAGMRQKVKLAQALIHSPRLVFLDEPTSGLDPGGREKMLSLIRSLARKKGVSVVVSTHILHDIEACCDSALIIGRGRLLEYDSIRNLQQAVDPSFKIRIEGGSADFITVLESLGCQGVVIGEEEIQLRGAGSDVSGKVFQAARQSGITVRGISMSRNSLENIFMTAVRETGGDRNGRMQDGGRNARGEENAHL
jgi:ABC-2 type transport system ATP-binding protein